MGGLTVTEMEWFGVNLAIIDAKSWDYVISIYTYVHADTGLVVLVVRI